MITKSATDAKNVDDMSKRLISNALISANNSFIDILFLCV